MVEANLVLFLFYFLFFQCFGSYFMVEKDGLQWNYKYLCLVFIAHGWEHCVCRSHNLKIHNPFAKHGSKISILECHSLLNLVALIHVSTMKHKTLLPKCCCLCWSNSISSCFTRSQGKKNCLMNCCCFWSNSYPIGEVSFNPLELENFPSFFEKNHHFIVTVKCVILILWPVYQRNLVSFLYFSVVMSMTTSFIICTQCFDDQ